MKHSCLFSLLSLAVALSTGSAQAQSSSARAQTGEAYGGLRALFSESVDFEGGSTIDSDDDLGLAFGGGYNVNDHLNLGGEFSWNNVDYDGTVISADNPLVSASLSGEYETFALAGNITWHLLKGPLTPFVSGTLGYTWIDTNIATGPPQIGCWYDPWFGQICDVFVDTKTDEAFSYGLGLGVRWDFDRGWFARFSYEERWFDVGKADGTPSFGGLHLDLGSKF